MASNDSNHLKRQRSPSVEITNVRRRTEAANTNNTRLQRQLAPPETGLAAIIAPAQDGWDAAVRTFTTRQGPRGPPCSHVQLNDVIVGRSNLTPLYGSAPYPPLDYEDSFATASMPPYPDHVGRIWERPHDPRPQPTVRQAAASSPTQVHPPPPASTLPASDAQGSGFVPPAFAQPNRRPTAAPTAAHPQAPASTSISSASTPQRSGLQPTVAIPPNPYAPVAGPHPATVGTQTANSVGPGESELQVIQRTHNIDIMDETRYRAGTAPIPQNVQDTVNQIQGIKKGSQGYPVRIEVKKIREHFVQSGGTMRSNSFLWYWYGDTRLFTREDWFYLATEGRGKQVPWP